LDTRTGAEIVELFRTLNHEQGMTIVVVTHDPEIGRQMDRIIGLRDGQLSDDVLTEYYNLAMPAIQDRVALTIQDAQDRQRSDKQLQPLAPSRK
jgi:putative ABC transport system ATP-binding protein